MNRRDLLKGSLIPALSAGRIRGANERIRLGLIGCGSRGCYVAKFMRDGGSADFVAFADCYLPNADKGKQLLNPEGAIYSDLRKLLERSDIDAVLIATPDHWHALSAIAACQAGKDVYVEKPVAHNIREGRAIARAARDHGRIVQVGTQHRSAPHFDECARIVQSGELGEVHLVRVWNYISLYPKGFGRPADAPVPAGLDWDLYQGPAPTHPFNPLRFLATYRWFWDYSGGLITDFGTHRFDTVHQIMGEDQPWTIAACGRRYAMRDLGEMPDTLQVTYEYPSFIMSYECSTLSSHGVGGRTPGLSYYRGRGTDDRPHGMAFYGTNGALFADRISYDVYPEPIDEQGTGSSIITGFRMQRKAVSAHDATAAHARSFIENIRARRRPAADIETGHRATLIGHLGNIALKTGLKLHWNAEQENFENQPEASDLLWREPRPSYNWFPGMKFTRSQASPPAQPASRRIQN